MISALFFLPWTLLSLAVEHFVPDPFESEVAKRLLDA